MFDDLLLDMGETMIGQPQPDDITLEIEDPVLPDWAHTGKPGRLILDLEHINPIVEKINLKNKPLKEVKSLIIESLLTKGIDITETIDNFSMDQLIQLMEGVEANIDISIYADVNFSTLLMKDIKNALIAEKNRSKK